MFLPKLDIGGEAISFTSHVPRRPVVGIVRNRGLAVVSAAVGEDDGGEDGNEGEREGELERREQHCLRSDEKYGLETTVKWGKGFGQRKRGKMYGT